MDSEKLLGVEQRHRDAAAAFYGPHLARPGEVPVTALMRAGKIDESPLIQAFSRFERDLVPDNGLREALEPFAKVLDDNGDDPREPDEADAFTVLMDCELTLGDLRRIRALYAKMKVGEPYSGRLEWSALQHNTGEVGLEGNHPSAAENSHKLTESAQEEITLLRADLKHAESAVVATCEGCMAPLFEDDDYVADPDGVTGCWAAMTDLPSKCERPCYAYRVGKPSALSQAPR